MARRQPKTRRVTSLEYLRTQVLGITKARTAEILGVLPKTIQLIEKDTADRIDMDQIRALHTYALVHDIKWPRDLMNLLLRGDLPIRE